MSFIKPPDMHSEKRQMYKKYVFIGLLASLFLLAFYFAIMTVATKSFVYTVDQFTDIWYWLVILILGFGIQFGIYMYLRDMIKKRNNQANSVAAASGGTSGVSMVACCAHHLTELLPLVGLSGAAVFLTQYQIPLIVLGIVMNIGGIFYMLRIIQKA